MTPKPVHFAVFFLILIFLCVGAVALGYLADVGNGRISPGDVRRIVEELEPANDGSQVVVQIATGIGIKQNAEPAMTITSTRTTVERAEPVKDNALLAITTVLLCIFAFVAMAAIQRLPDWPFDQRNQ